MSTKNTKKSTSSNSVASFNWCATPRFPLFMRRRINKLANPPSRPSPSHSAPAAGSQVALLSDSKKRLRDLERDIDRLKARIRQENRRDHTKRYCDLVGEEKEGEPGPITVRFPDGSFVHEITRIGKPWERLCMHVSLPTVAEDATTAAEVLKRFTMMKVTDLCRCLMSLMPMTDVSGLKFTDPAGTPYYPDNVTKFLSESILFVSVKQLEKLVLEGLKIQLCGTRRSENHSTDASSVTNTNLDATASRSTDNSDWVVLVTLIQMRDPKEDFGPVGELMVGLIEAQLGENGSLYFSIEGVHVAGLNLARNKMDGRDFMWSVSSKCCGGSDGSGTITRNQNYLFPSSALEKD